MDEQRDSNGKRPGGITGKGFGPGRSGNPNGRKKGAVVEAVRKFTGTNGQKLWEAAALLAFGTTKQVEKHFGEPVKVDARARLDAMKFLADRGFGKAVETVEHSGVDGQPIAVTFGGRYRQDGTTKPAA